VGRSISHFITLNVHYTFRPRTSAEPLSGSVAMLTTLNGSFSSELCKYFKENTI